MRYFVLLVAVIAVAAACTTNDNCDSSEYCGCEKMGGKRRCMPRAPVGSSCSGFTMCPVACEQGLACQDRVTMPWSPQMSDAPGRCCKPLAEECTCPEGSLAVVDSNGCRTCNCRPMPCNGQGPSMDGAFGRPCPCGEGQTCDSEFNVCCDAVPTSTEAPVELVGGAHLVDEASDEVKTILSCAQNSALDMLEKPSSAVVEVIAAATRVVSGVIYTLRVSFADPVPMMFGAPSKPEPVVWYADVVIVSQPWVEGNECSVQSATVVEKDDAFLGAELALSSDSTPVAPAVDLTQPLQCLSDFIMSDNDLTFVIPVFNETNSVSTQVVSGLKYRFTVNTTWVMGCGDKENDDDGDGDERIARRDAAEDGTDEDSTRDSGNFITRFIDHMYCEAHKASALNETSLLEVTVWVQAWKSNPCSGVTIEVVSGPSPTGADEMAQSALRLEEEQDMYIILQIFLRVCAFLCFCLAMVFFVSAMRKRMHREHYPVNNVPVAPAYTDSTKGFKPALYESASFSSLPPMDDFTDADDAPLTSAPVQRS